MARVWRDGQRRPCFVYRLLSTGTIEEKIFQRQVSKQALSGAVVDAEFGRSPTFDIEQLRELFHLDERTRCSTHELLNCDCTSMADDDDRLLKRCDRKQDTDSETRDCQLLPRGSVGKQKARSLALVVQCVTCYYLIFDEILSVYSRYFPFHVCVISGATCFFFQRNAGMDELLDWNHVAGLCPDLSALVRFIEQFSFFFKNPLITSVIRVHEFLFWHSPRDLFINTIRRVLSHMLVRLLPRTHFLPTYAFILFVHGTKKLLKTYLFKSSLHHLKP